MALYFTHWIVIDFCHYADDQTDPHWASRSPFMLVLESLCYVPIVLSALPCSLARDAQAHLVLPLPSPRISDFSRELCFFLMVAAYMCLQLLGCHRARGLSGDKAKVYLLCVYTHIYLYKYTLCIYTHKCFISLF